MYVAGAARIPVLATYEIHPRCGLPGWTGPQVDEDASPIDTFDHAGGSNAAEGSQDHHHDCQGSGATCKACLRLLEREGLQRFGHRVSGLKRMALVQGSIARVMD